MSNDKVIRLYRRYGAVIYARCLRMLGDRAGAEDATQETFVRVFKHVNRAPDEREAVGWIYRIATNYCLNELRNRKRRPTPCEIVPEVGGAGAEAAERKQFVRQLIVQAPAQQAAAAWLHHVDGFGQEEVGRILGISRRTVINRLRAFQRRVDRLKGDLDG